MGLEKNVASQKWLVFAFNRTTNIPKTGDALNITAKIRKDFGAATGLGDVNPAEVEDGYYEFDLTQAEVNAKVLDLLPESSTADIQVIGVPGRIFTVGANFSDAMFEADGMIHADIKEWLGAAPLALISQLVQGQANQLAAQAKSDVNDEVVDGLGTDTIPELPVGLPPATPTIQQALMILYMSLRDGSESEASPGEHRIKNDAGVVIAKQILTKTATLFTRGKMTSG